MPNWPTLGQEGIYNLSREDITFYQVILPLFRKFQGVKKVYGLDISSGMIEAANRELSDLGIRYQMCTITFITLVQLVVIGRLFLA